MDSKAKLPAHIISKYGADLMQALLESRLPLNPPA